MIFFVLLFPLIVGAQELDHGALGPLKKSLNEKEYSYKVIDDPTGKAPAKKVEYFELRAGDCSKNISWDDCKNDRERIELMQRQETKVEKQTLWYGWSFYLDKKFQFIWPVKLSLAQFFDDGAGQPAWMFQVNDKGLFIESMVKNKKIMQQLIPLGKLAGQWHAVTIQVKWSNKDDGLLNLWINDKKQLSYKGPTIISDKLFFKYGLYRTFVSRYKTGSSLPTQSIYFSNVKMGKAKKNISH